MSNLVNEMETTVDGYPAETAVKHRRGGTEMTYEEFWDEAGRFAAALRKASVEPGDRVAVYLPNLPEFVTAFVGVLRNGSVVVPLNPQYKAREIEHILADSGANVVVTLPGLVGEVRKVESETDVREVLTVGDESEADGAEDVTAYDDFLADEPRETEQRDDDDIAAQPYTSGTTGDPKGVLLTHGNLSFVAEATPKVHDGIRTDDKMLGVLPLFHIYGMTVNMLATLYEGGSYHLMTEWDAGDTLELIEDEGITILHGVPAMYNDLINHSDADEYTLESVRFANAGGDSLPLDTIRRFEEGFAPKLVEGYGLTETAPTTHANSNDERRKGSIGKPLPGVKSKVVDENFEEMPRVERGPVEFSGGGENGDGYDYDEIVGEIVVSGPNVMKGYYELPRENEDAFTEADGKRWFHTGDLGYSDEDDFFYVVDREKHMIVTGGYNVYPREVEELLFEHPEVAEAAVVGVPDERKGETVKAYVVTQPDASVTPDEIRTYCLENLAEYKHPREVEFVEELPRTASGKVQKFRLRGDGDD